MRLGGKPKQEEALLPISSLSSCFVLWNGRVPFTNMPIPPTNVVSSVGRVIVPLKSSRGYASPKTLGALSIP